MAGVKDVVDHQDMGAVEAFGQAGQFVADQQSLADRGGAAIRADRNEADGHFQRQEADQVGDEDDAAGEDGHERDPRGPRGPRGSGNVAA